MKHGASLGRGIAAVGTVEVAGGLEAIELAIGDHVILRRSVPFFRRARCRRILSRLVVVGT
jgi:hypothetical protein